jgi:hypothetical protein
MRARNEIRIVTSGSANVLDWQACTRPRDVSGSREDRKDHDEAEDDGKCSKYSGHNAAMF